MRRAVTVFDIFKSKSFSDPELGAFTRARGVWRGSIVLGGETVPLALEGDGTAPDAAALTAARQAAAWFAAVRPALEAALRDHREPYADDVLPADELWEQTHVQFVSATRMQGAMTVEVGLSVEWDEDHTLGARLRDGALVELNGSVLAP